MFVISACMEAHAHTYSHTLTILGRGPDRPSMSALSPRSGIQVSSVYPTYTHIKGHCPLCVCVRVCSQASRSRAMLSCDSSYFSYCQGTIQTSYAVIRQLLLIAMLLQIFYSNSSCFSLLLLYLGNSQVSVYRNIGPTLIKVWCDQSLSMESQFGTLIVMV